MGGILIQSVSTAIACYNSLMMGICLTWPSSTVQLFGSTNTTLNRPMTEVEISLLGSLSSIGALLSTPLVGYALDTLGRKYSSVIIALSYVIFWGILAGCNRVDVVLIAIFISGIGGCIYLVVPIYVSEICQESIRGMMTCGTIVFLSSGMLLSYLLGGVLDYYTMIYTCLTMSVIGLLLLGVLKETPLLLMKKGLGMDAARSIAFYRSTTVNSKIVKEEMDALRRALNPDMDETPEEEKLKPEPTNSAEKLSLWKFIRKSRSTRQAFLLEIIMFAAAFLQGLLVVQVYAEPLFMEAVPNMSSTLSTVLFAVLMIVGGLVGAYLVDKIGRKPLMIYSSLAAGVCCVVMGTQLQLKWAPHAVSAVAMFLYCFTYTLGAGTVPYVLMVDLFLPEVKSIMSMLLIEYAWIVNFILLFIFNPLVSAIGLGPVFYIFAGACFVTPIYCVFYQPETKGLPVDSVQTLFLKKKKNNLSISI